MLMSCSFELNTPDSRWTEYYRTALILNPGPDFDELCYEDQGYSYIFKFLESFKERGIKKTDPKYTTWTARAIEWFTDWSNAIVKAANLPVRQSKKWTPEHTQVIYRFALDYEDESLLSTILPSKIVSLDDLDAISEPWGVLGFEKLRPGYVNSGYLSRTSVLIYL